MSKPILLTFVDHYLPGYKAGGPIQTVANAVAHLSSEFHFKIITSDRDLGDEVAYPGLVADVWGKVGEAEVIYLSPRSLAMGYLRALLHGVDYDVLYLNSMVSPKFTLIPLFLQRCDLVPRKPVVIAPRGELAPSALVQKSWKKKTFLATARPLGLYQHVLWQASSQHEQAQCLQHFPEARVLIARDLAATIEVLEKHRRKAAGELKIVFLARLVPVKNLDFALHALAGLRGQVSFTIFGPREDMPYWDKCVNIIEALPNHVKVSYGGQLPHNKVAEQLREQDLLLLPTRGENFGHVIIEALTAGCPVLISDRTPWRALEAKGVGWDVPLECPERFQEILQHCVDLDQYEYRALCQRAQAYGQASSRDESAIEQHRMLFHTALGTDISSRPTV